MSDSDATASAFGVPPLEDPALRTYLPWEVVYHSVAGASEGEETRRLVLDPLTGFFRECNSSGPLSRIWVLDQGASLVGFDAQHKFERTSFAPSPGGGRAGVGMIAEFKCVLTGRHIRTSTDVAAVAPLIGSTVVEQAGGAQLEEAAASMVHAAMATALMERVRVHAVAAGGKLARATGMPSPPAGLPAGAEADAADDGAVRPGAAELCVHPFGDDSPSSLAVVQGDAATDRMLWTDIGITAVAEAAGCVVRGEGVFVPAEADYPEAYAASAAIGRICTETLTAMQGIVHIGVQARGSSTVLMLWDHIAWPQTKDNPSLAQVPALWERLVNAGAAVDELVGGAAASARSALYRAQGARAAAMRHAYSTGADPRALQTMTATLVAADGVWKVLSHAAGAAFVEPIDMVQATAPPATSSKPAAAAAKPATSSEADSAAASGAAGAAAASSAPAEDATAAASGAVGALAAASSDPAAVDAVPGCSGLIIRATPPDVRAARVAVDTVRMTLGLRLGADAGTCSAVPLRSPGQPAGLQNLGNTCYLNAMLQAIAHCPQLRNRILLLRTDAAAGRARAFVAEGVAARAPERTLAHARRMLRATDLLAELQHLVALLVASDRQSVDPSQFVEAFAACKGGEGSAQPALWSSLAQFRALVAKDEKAAADGQKAADEAFTGCMLSGGQGCAPGDDHDSLVSRCRAEAQRTAAAFIGARVKLGIRGQSSAPQPRFNALAFFAQEDADEWRDSILTLADDVALGFAALPDGGFNGVAANAEKDTPRHFGAPQSTLAGVNSLRGALSAVAQPVERRDGVTVASGPAQPLDAFRLTPVLAEVCTDASGLPVEDMMTAMHCCADPALAVRHGVTVTADLCQTDFAVALPASKPESLTDSKPQVEGADASAAHAPADTSAGEHKAASTPEETSTVDQTASSTKKCNANPAEPAFADGNDAPPTSDQTLTQQDSNDEPAPAVAATASVAAPLQAAPPDPPVDPAAAAAAAVADAAAAAATATLPPAFGLFASGQPGVYPALSARFEWGADGRPASRRVQLLALPPVVYLSIARSSSAELRTRVRVPLLLCLDDLVGEAPPEEGGDPDGVMVRDTSLDQFDDVMGSNQVVRSLRQHVDRLYRRHSRERFGLRAVLVHTGPTSEGGHYVCFAAGEDGVWWRLDDDSVTAVSVEDMLEAAEGGSAVRRASTLFYEREADGMGQAIDQAGLVDSSEGAAGEGDAEGVSASAAVGESSSVASPTESPVSDDVTPGGILPLGIRASPWDKGFGFAPEAPAEAAPVEGAPPPAVVAESGPMWWRDVVPAERVCRVVSSVRGTLLPRRVAAFIAADNRHVQASGTLEAADSAGIRLGTVLADIARTAAAAASTAQRPREIVGVFGMTRAELERWARDEVALLVRINGIERGIAAATLVHPAKGELSLPRPLSPAELKAGWGGAGWLASGLRVPEQAAPTAAAAASGAGGGTAAAAAAAAASGAGGPSSPAADASAAGGGASVAGERADDVAEEGGDDTCPFEVVNADCEPSASAETSKAKAEAGPFPGHWPALAFTSWDASATTATDGSQRLSTWFARPPWVHQLTLAEHVGICAAMLKAYGPDVGPVSAPCQSRLSNFAQRYPVGVRWTRAPATALLSWSTLDHSQQGQAGHRQWAKAADAFRQADWTQGPVSAMVARLRGLEGRRAAAAAVAAQGNGDVSAALGTAEGEAWLVLGGAAEGPAASDARADCVDEEVMASLAESDPTLPLPSAQLPGPEAPIRAPPLPGVPAAAAFARALCPGVAPRLEREFVIPLVVSPAVSTAKTIHWFVMDEASALDADHLRHLPADWIIPDSTYLRMRAMLRSTDSLDACLEPAMETAKLEPQLRLGGAAFLMLTSAERAVLAASDEFASHPLGSIDSVNQPYTACRRVALPRGTVAGLLMQAFGTNMGDAASRIAVGTRLRSAHAMAEMRRASILERSGGSARCVLVQTGVADSMLA